MINQSRLHEILSYDEETGHFHWKVENKFRSQQTIGDVAGYINQKGYRMVGIDGTYYPQHRLVWLYKTGKMPPQWIDHINGDKSDNRFSNLRCVTTAQNRLNLRHADSDNKTGLLGVSYHKGKYRATIKIGSKCKHLGYFNNPIEAHACYVEAKRKHHTHCSI